MTVVFEETFQQTLDKQSWTEDYTITEVENLKHAIEVHRYGGPSKKRHNGIVPIRSVDSNLLKILDKLTTRLPNEIKLQCTSALPIKVVAHVPTGWTNVSRMIGYRYNNGNILVLGIANYY